MTAHYNRHGTLTFPLPASAPADASPIADYDYQFADLDGKITQETRTAGGSATQVRQYTYDGIGRLATYTKPNGTVRTYTMDLDSNRTGISETPSGGTATTIETLVYDPLNAASDGIDEMTSRAVSGVTTTYTYDSDGRTTVQTGGAARTLTWDGRDRMTQAVQGANTIVNTYDAEGALRRRSVNAGTPAQSRDYTQVNEGGGFELNLDGTISSTIIDGPAGGLISYSGAPAIATTAAFQYFNAHGDSAATANATGVRQDGPNGYDPYGAQEDGTTPAANAAADRWTGRWHKKTDTSLSLVQMGARQYDLATGRFLTVDPIDGGSLNNYEYAGQDPINQYDLNGQWCGWRKYLCRAGKFVAKKVWHCTKYGIIGYGGYGAAAWLVRGASWTPQGRGVAIITGCIAGVFQ